MSTSVPLAQFLPDIASVDASACSIARNVSPRADGYGPVKGPVPITLPLPDACRGFISVQSPGYGYTTYFAGTRTKLYKLNLSTTGWTDVTPADAQFGISENAYWSFALYGDRLVATPTGGSSLVIHVDRDKRFKTLGGSPPRARFNGVIGEFLVLAHLGFNRNGLQWSDVGDIERWTPGFFGQSGDVQIMPDGGAITGFAGGEFGLVFQERTIRRMIYNPGSRTVFDFSVAEQNRGCISPSAVVTVGGRAFFVDRDGFYSISGGVSSPIGAQRVNQFFIDRVSPQAMAATVAIRDTTGPRVIFAYRSKAADPADPTILDEALLYDWQLDRWSFLALKMRYGMAVATPSASLDALPGSVDTMTKSLDSPEYLGGEPGFGIVTADNRVAMLTGETLEAVMETAEAQLARPARSFVTGMRLDTDAADWRVSVGTRESLKVTEQPRMRPEAGPGVEGYAPARASGRYHRARIRIPASTEWSYVKGIEPQATTEGLK